MRDEDANQVLNLGCFSGNAAARPAAAGAAPTGSGKQEQAPAAGAGLGPPCPHTPTFPSHERSLPSPGNLLPPSRQRHTARATLPAPEPPEHSSIPALCLVVHGQPHIHCSLQNLLLEHSKPERQRELEDGAP